MSNLISANIVHHNSFGDLTIITDQNENIWFIAKELAEKLDYQKTCNLTGILDVDEHINRTWQEMNEINNLGCQIPPRGLTLINESGLYHACFRSSKPEAKKFRNWVTSEVLPQIRKTGSYSLTPAQPSNEVELYLESKLDLITKQIEDILDKKINKLISYKYITKKSYTFNEAVDLINERHAPYGTKMYVSSLKDFMIHIGMLRSYDNPIKKYLDNKYLIEINNPFKNDPTIINIDLLITKLGLKHIIQELTDRGYTRI